MGIDAQVSFEGLEHSDTIEARILEEAGKLTRHHERISSLRVVVSRPQHRHHKGDIYQVRIHATVPDAPDVIVTREPAATGAHEDVWNTIIDAFKTANRQLQDLAGKRVE